MCVCAQGNSKYKVRLGTFNTIITGARDRLVLKLMRLHKSLANCLKYCDIRVDGVGLAPRQAGNCDIQLDYFQRRYEVMRYGPHRGVVVGDKRCVSCRCSCLRA